MNEFPSLLLQSDLPEPSGTGLVGSLGEELAARFLEVQGYQLIMANFKVPVGRNSNGALITGEIDLIGLEVETLCFIEVKTRRSDDFASPTANINIRKQRQITRTSKIYRRIFGMLERPYRFDVVSIVLGDSQEPKIELFRSFWDSSKFRKSRWQFDTWV
jgi:putative endonuclease